jgi:glycerol-3-phosphate acyltransferase PlsY
MIYLRYAIIVAVAYLLGNISTGVIVSKSALHTDIRKHGSGNAGATNMLRTFGWLPSVLTLVGDCAKAVVAALFGKFVGGEYGMLLAGVAVVVGHNWPVFYGFRGGKGIAASLGLIIVTSPLIAAILLVVEVAVVALTRYMSVASIFSALLYPFLTWAFYPNDAPRIVASVVVGALALFSHRANIARLIKRNENRLDFRKIRDISRKKREGEG